MLKSKINKTTKSKTTKQIDNIDESNSDISVLETSKEVIDNNIQLQNSNILNIIPIKINGLVFNNEILNIENTETTDTSLINTSETNEIVRGKNYYKNQKRKQNLKRKQEEQKNQKTENNNSTLKQSEIEKIIEKPIDTNKNKKKAKVKDDKQNKSKDINKKISLVKEFLYTQISEDKKLSKSQSRNEFLINFLNKVEEYLIKKAYIEPGGKILLAVSGGVDSIVLLDALALLTQKIRFSLYVAHFNHKLRGLSADADEGLVRNICKEYNLHFYSGSGNVRQYSSKNGISIEHAARILRYNFFERTARNIGVDIVATAHNEDDLVETFFINLFRGSGLTGLSSMPSKRKFVKNVTLVRPFLQFNKSILYNYAKIRKLAWNEDETNALLNYTRNKVRHDLLPKLINEYNPSIIEVINRTAELIQGADEVIKDLVVKNISNILDESSNDRFYIKINMLLTYNKFMQGEFLQFAWNKYFRLQPLSLAVIDRILELIDKQTGSICEISSGYIVLRDRNHLVFTKKIKEFDTSVIIEKIGNHKIGRYKFSIKEVSRQEMKFSQDKFTEYIDADFMNPYFEIRNKKEGDIFLPLGAPGEMKLSDFLTNSKVSLIDKSNILILTNKIDILWVIGHRISDKCKVTKETKKILQLKFINTD